NPNHNTTLGVLTGAEYTSVGGTGTYGNLPYSATDNLVKYTYYGDTDFNGRVNFDDYVRTDNGFNNHLSGWLNGDFDLNGSVNFDDYVLIDLAFNTQSGTLDRALRFLDGADASNDEMNSPARLRVARHFAQFVDANVDLPRYPSINPDGSQIVFTWRGDLWKASSKGGFAERLTSHPLDDLASAWSRDGKRIAFSSTRAGGGNFFMMNADGTGIRQ